MRKTGGNPSKRRILLTFHRKRTGTLGGFSSGAAFHPQLGSYGFKSEEDVGED